MGYKNGLSAVVAESSISTLLIDMDRTLTEGNRAYPGVPETLAQIINSGVRIFVVTNSTIGCTKAVETLQARGLEQGRHFTDAFGTGSVIKAFLSLPKMQGKKILTLFHLMDKSIFAVDGNVEIMHSGFSLSCFRKALEKFNPDYIYIGTPYYSKESVVSLNNIEKEFGEYIKLIASAEKPLLAGFKDTNFRQDGRLIVLQGDILKKVSALNPLIEVKTFGKPSKAIFNALAHKYPEIKYQRATMMMAGDNPETDMEFARNLGIMYTHVLTSKSLSGKKANYLIPSVGGQETSEPDLKPLFELLKHNDFCRG